jgi:ABC-type lipoprotein release transport system permease subunit
MKLLALAIRNLLRNPRRSIITVLAISVGLAVMILGLSLQYGSYQDMIANGVSQTAGHVVVQNIEYQADKKPEYTLSNASEIAETIKKASPEATVTQRIFIPGLIQSPHNPSPASFIGVEPISERLISPMADKLIDGEWLTASPQDIVVGAGMAKTLNAKIGDKVVVTVQVAEGDPNTAMFRVKGIFKSGGQEMDAFIAFIHYHAAQDLLKTEEALERPDIVHQIGAHIENADDAAVLKSKIELPKKTSDSLDILTWREALPDLVGLIDVDKKSNGFIHFILALIVAIGILNTMLMSVMERTRELGVLLAIGMRPRKLSIMVLMEGLVLGVVGALLGLGLGWLFSYPLVHNGLDMSAQMGEGMEMSGFVVSTIIYGSYNWPMMFTYAAIAVLFSILSALYPAWRITRLNPVSAMRHH